MGLVLVAPPKKKDGGNCLAIPRVPHKFDLCHVTKPLKDVYRCWARAAQPMVVVCLHRDRNRHRERFVRNSG